MTQSTTPQTAYRTKLAAGNLPYEIDVGQDSVIEWDDALSIAAAGVVRPTQANATGFVYLNGATAGQTGTLEPAWPTTSGGTVTDGSLTWTAAAPPAVGQDTIASATWTQVSPPDSALTITGETNTSLVASAFIGGGTSGSVYEVEILVTMHSGAIFAYLLILTIL